MTHFGLSNITIHKIQSVFENHTEIDSVIIYGSRAKGNYRVGSDIDLTLLGDKLNNTILTKIEQEIDELNTPYLFDISIFDSLKSPDLEAHINRIGQIFYKKNEQ
ncbi:MAG: nucleotidyltransferase domain-containing protein [Pseudarcicella sp.]|nr:nucleotidyltransferase domain-containing protein [Pseudarcicella sp.]MBP6411419.1 nucleotidyltransferase domain-containing protein [Pseudarcicella sp.]